MRNTTKLMIAGVAFALAYCMPLSIATAAAPSGPRTIPHPPSQKNVNPTPQQAKIDGLVRDMIDRLTADGVQPGHPPADVRARFSNQLVKIDDRARLQLYLELNAVNDTSIADLNRVAEVDVEIANPALHLIQAWVPYDEIVALAAHDSVRRVRAPEYAAFQTGSVTTQGDSILRANLVRSTFNITGAGVKVGVISDGANNQSSSQASGDLPPSITVFGSCSTAVTGSTCNEGTAMMEIIHDMAPDATLAMGDSATSLDFVQRVTDLTNWGANVIVDDLSNFGQPYFEDGSMAAAYANALAQGVVMVSAAGNYAQRHYQGAFYDSRGAGWNDFGGGDEVMTFTVQPGRTASVFLEWSNRFGQSSDDYDLYIYDAALTNVVASSTNYQLGFSNPFEATSVACTGTSTCTFNAAIYRPYFATAQTMEMFIIGGTPTNHVVSSDSVFGHTAVPGVISVAAINASDPGVLTIEPYSSLGPSTIFFPSFLQRATPSITTVDCVADTGAGGFSTTFCGTSAAAPHAAAIAALLRQAKSSLTPLQVESAMQNTAVDRGFSGYDYTYGSGLADAYAAVSSVLPSCTDSYEPNNSSTQAYGPISAGAVYSGKICSGADVDWFKMNLTAGQSLTITLTVPSANDFDLELYDTNGLFRKGSYNGTGQTETITDTVPASGTYFVRVYGYLGSYSTQNYYGLSYNGFGPQTLSVSKTGAGSGTVTSSPAGINCGSTCQASFAYNAQVTLTAAASSGSQFVSWSGACAGSLTQCTVTMSQALAVSANFGNAPQRLTVTKNGTGSGTVSSSPAGISCGGTCVYDFVYNTLVTLSAAATSPATFNGWSGEGCAGTGTCQVTMSQARNVTATFSGAPHGLYVVTPCRLIDTRNAVGPYGGPSLAAGGTRNVVAVGQCGIPSGATSLSVNLTDVNAASSGWLTLFPGPAGAPMPWTSTLNYAAGRTLANNAILTVGADGSINVYNSGPYGINFIIDINGYFQ